MNKGLKSTREWFRQAFYDYETAEGLFLLKRYIYAIFFSHLAIEKALKGLYSQELLKVPPKIHVLSYFAAKLSLTLPKELEDILVLIDEISVPTRYPDELSKLIREFSRDQTKIIIDGAIKVLKWLEKLQK